MTDVLLYERREAAIYLTLNRPDRLNALDSSLANALADTLEAVAVDESARVVVLRGAGRAFCAGLDIHAYRSGGDRSGIDRLSEIVLRVRHMPQVVVAAVRGPAIGGGFAFALAADLRVVGASASFRDGFVNVGLSGCELGLSQMLPEAVGRSIATELMLTGRPLTAERALSIGFVAEVVADEELASATDRVVDELLAVSPIGLRRTKETLALTSRDDTLEAVIARELSVQHECMEHPDHAAALQRFASRGTARS